VTPLQHNAGIIGLPDEDPCYQKGVRMCKCVCNEWESQDLGMLVLTGHHEQCSSRSWNGDIKQLRTLIKAMAIGMEYWAWDEDGVHPKAWNAYQKAKELLMEPVKLTEA